MKSTPTPRTSPPKALTKLLNTVEWLGNLLPHPVTLFALFSVVLILFSGIAGYFELSVIDPRPEGASGRSAEGTITIISLFNVAGLHRILTSLVSNFTGFAPLGTVLVALLGVSLAEHSGLLAAAMRGLVLGASRRMVTFTVVFTGVISNTASELGYVVLIPLAAMLFHTLGRHPLAGLAAAFAGVSGGYSANLFLGTLDPLLSGITQTAARLIDPVYVVGAEVNWYFMVASTFLITLLGTFITEKIVEPQLGPYQPEAHSETLTPILSKLTPLEKRGLLGAGLTAALLSLLFAYSIVPADGILRHPDTGAVTGSPFLSSIVALIFIFFALPGYVYGKVTGSFRRDVDVVNAMSQSMSTMGMYLVIVFAAAQFTAFFGWTNTGQVLAVAGATFLQNIGLVGPGLFMAFILICAIVNLSLGSASAQWAITAPIFVPMLMLVGYAPEVIQAAYRIGDSVTNIVTPMMTYFGMILAVAGRYQKNLGLGTLIATMLPYSVAFLIGWSLLFYLWVFVFGLPVGPGAATYYP